MSIIKAILIGHGIIAFVCLIVVGFYFLPEPIQRIVGWSSLFIGAGLFMGLGVFTSVTYADNSSELDKLLQAPLYREVADDTLDDLPELIDWE